MNIVVSCSSPYCRTVVNVGLHDTGAELGLNDDPSLKLSTFIGGSPDLCLGIGIAWLNWGFTLALSVS